MMELLVSLKGQIDKSIPESVRKAMDDIGKLQKKQGELKGIEARANQYKALEQAAQSLGEQFNQAKTKAAQLEAEFKRNQAAAAQYQAQISQAKAALAGMNRSANPEAYRAAKASIAQLTSAHKAAQAAAKASGRAFQQAEKSAKASGKEYSRNQADLKKLSDGLHQAGFNTQQFAASQDALQRELAETGAALAQAKQVKAQYDKQIEEQAKRQQAHNEAQQAFHNATENLQNTWYFAKDVAAPFIAATKSAMQFQSAMADVRKVVDFETPEQFKEMGSDILRLTRTLPMAAEDLAKIVAAGGQSGIAKRDLLAFAESAAKMGVAFDITADQAGEMMAKWRTAFKLNQADVVKLADQINYLSDTTAASAPLISDVVTRIGPLGEIGGVASGEIAALGASMVGAGVQTEIASTGIKNLILAMTAGESAMGRQREAFAALGLDAKDMAARMQTDAKGAILDLFAALQKLPKEAQGANLSHIVGKESIAAIAPLLSNLDALRENFEKVGDASKYSGSMEKEFAARSKTAENSLQLLRNAANEIAINIGNAFLPMVADAAALAATWADAISDLADEHPRLIRLLGILTAAVAGVVLTALTVNAAVSGWRLLGTTFRMVAEDKALETIGGQVGGLLGTLKSAPGKIGKAIIGLPKTFSAAMGKIPTIIAGAGQSIMGIPAMISGAFTAIPGIVSGAFASLAAVGWPVILGILAIVAVVALVAANFDKLKETAAIVFNHISGTVAAWAAVLQAKFDAAANKIAEVWNSITGQSLQSSELIGAIFNNLGFVLGAAFDIAAGIIGTAISVIINWVTSVAQIVGGVINIVAGLLTGDWDRAWKGAGQAVEGFAGGTLGTIKTIAGGIGDIFDTLMGKSAEVQRQAEQAKAQQDLIAKSRDAKVT
ncbi:MAG: phage tail tape measure protein, partial [Schwartzia sp.]|nr:phage tail tape measure protein [Schwartzia sp. (in: firmicutes)]